ncbi:transposase domain-containing protein [Acinetobacter baumannii]|uniref:transposase domain-containing protein n=1 Tax=Acinetobacter baumannii TaxID=470 RepID=UPI003916F47D
MQSSNLNGFGPYYYLNDVLKRKPTHKLTQIDELLPHCRKPKSNSKIGIGFSGRIRFISVNFI